MQKHIIGVCGRKGSGKDSIGDILCKEYGFQRVALADPIKRLVFYIFGLTPETLFGPSHTREMEIAEAANNYWWNSAYTIMYSDAIRDQLHTLFGISAYDTVISRLEMITRTVLEPYRGRITARVILQQLGTEWGRAISSDVWIREVLRMSTLAIKTGHYDPLFPGNLHILGSNSAPKEIGHRINGTVITDVRFENEVLALRDYGGIIWTVNAQQRLPAEPVTAHASEPPYAQTELWANSVIDNNKSLTELKHAVTAAAHTWGLIRQSD